MDGQVYYLTLITQRWCLTCLTFTHAATCRCESVRKVVEWIFGILKKRFHILKMTLTDKSRMDLCHMEDDWYDHTPDDNRERRTLYDTVNDLTFLFNTCPYVVVDNTDFSH